MDQLYNRATETGRARKVERMRQKLRKIQEQVTQKLSNIPKDFGVAGKHKPDPSLVYREHITLSTLLQEGPKPSAITRQIVQMADWSVGLSSR